MVYLTVLFSLMILFDNIIILVVYSLSCVRLFWDPTDCSLPGSSLQGSSQARTPEWVAISYSKGLSNLGIDLVAPTLADAFFTTEPPGKPSGYISLLNNNTKLNAKISSLHREKMRVLLNHSGLPSSFLRCSGWNLSSQKAWFSLRQIQDMDDKY